MIKWLLIALIAGATLSTAAAFSEAENPEDYIPILENLGGNIYETIVSTIDYAVSLVDIWAIETDVVGNDSVEQ